MKYEVFRENKDGEVRSIEYLGRRMGKYEVQSIKDLFCQWTSTSIWYYYISRKNEMK